MSLLNVFDVTGSAMSAQQVRLNTTASNLANADSVTESPENTYRARHPVFAATLLAAGSTLDNLDRQSTNDRSAARSVRVLGIVESDAPLQQRYEPDHPFADEQGYVSYPNVSPVSEMADMISASRSFQLNVEIMNTAKTLAQRLLNLGQ